MASRRTILQLLIVPALVFVPLYRWFKRKKDKYDGLDGIVSFTSRLIAAARACETLEEDRIINDPLARLLGGECAFEACWKRREPYKPLPGEPVLARKNQIGLMALRTRWFDDRLLLALASGISPNPTKLTFKVEESGGAQKLAVAIEPVVVGDLRQVVMLGAGMDSRPWRLPLPPGVAWFEVDRDDVLGAKQKALLGAGAEFRPLPGSTTQGGASPTEPKSAPAYPLAAAGWVGLGADLQDPEWMQSLMKAGFDPSKPTIWVAEGLLMYFEPDAVLRLMKQLSDSSPVGSVFLAISLHEKTLDRVHNSKSEVMRSWKFGCSSDPSKMFEETGWTLVENSTRTDIVKELKLTKGSTGSRSSSSQSLFLIAVKN